MFLRYGEVMKMLGSRGGGPAMSRMHEGPLRGGAAARRRHGSLSSLPSSSVSGRPIRDRRRTDDRRKVRDIKVSRNSNVFIFSLEKMYEKFVLQNIIDLE